MAKIDRVEDLPKWFDLEKYKECESFGATEWLAHLDIRSYLLSKCPSYPDDYSLIRYELMGDSETSHEAHLAKLLAKAKTIWKNSIRLRAEALRADPVVFPLPQSDEGFLRWKISATRPVRSVIFGDLTTALHTAVDNLTFDGNEEINAQLQGWDHIGHDIKAAAHYLEEFRSNSEPYAPTGPHYIKEDIEIERTPVEPAYWESLISVDLEASDAVLVESFKTWVKEARARQKFTAISRRKSSYDRWARYGLLPYLDLLTWSLETDVHIPDRVMSAAISRYDAGEANLRKTVAPLAADLMCDLSGLRALATVENAEPETFEG